MYEVEGTWEEIAALAPQLVGQHVRLTVLTQANGTAQKEPQPPSACFAAAMEEAEELERDLPFTPGGEETQRFLREARSGAMYGHDLAE